MDEGSTTMALTTRLRKRSISSHLYPTADNENRTTIRTKIQKIDGQYKASSTCNNEQERAHSSDDQDEPQIIGTVPPAVPNSSKYRTREDNFDDESDEDRKSNASSTDGSPLHRSQSADKSTIITIPKVTQSLNDNGNETTDETSVHIPSMSTRHSTRVLSDEDDQNEASSQESPKTNKKTTSNKPSLSNSSTNPPVEPTATNTTNSQLPLPNETPSMTEDTTNKSTSSIDANASNKNPSQTSTDPPKVKLRVKPIPPSPQTKKDNKQPVTSIKNTKPVEQKPIKKPVPTPKETVNTAKKPTTTTVKTKTPLKPSVAKPATNTNNSEKPSVRPSSSTALKPVEKKSSDTSNTSVTPKISTEPPPTKPPPVSFGKIPKLNPANKPKPAETLTPTSTKDSNIPKRRSPLPTQSNRPVHNAADNSDRFAPQSPTDLLDSMGNTSGKSSSLNESNPRLYTSFSRTNPNVGENAQSQSPLSPGPSSTLYPPPSPPAIPPLFPPRPISSASKPFSDSRLGQSHLQPPTNELSQSFNRKKFPTPPVLPRPTSSSSLTTAQSMPILPLMSSDAPDPRTTMKKPDSIWDSASSDEEPEDNTSARRFFHQNMRAVDEELSKIDELFPITPVTPVDMRTEQLLKRQQRASLCLSSNGGTYDSNPIEASASVDDFECVAMDLDSPKHRTQSESSDNNPAVVDVNNSKKISNGPADSKSAESITASSTDTSKKLLSKNRPLKATSMTLIDELKNSINPTSASKQTALSPPSHSLSRSRSRSRSRTHSRSRSRSRSRSKSRSRSHSRSRSRSSSSSSSSRKRSSRSRHRSSKRRSSKHYSRRRSNSYEKTNDRPENHASYPPAAPHYQSHHHPPHPQQHWPSTRQPTSLFSGPAPPPLQTFGHQQPIPPLLPNHPYYPPSNRSLMHPVEPNNAGGRFNYPQNAHQRQHLPLMNPSYFPPPAAPPPPPPPPLMQTASHGHPHPINRYPPPSGRPFEMPSHPIGVPNQGLLPPNANYNQFRYESEEHQTIRRAKPGTNTNNRRGGSRQTGPNGRKKMSNPSKSNNRPYGHHEIDQLFQEREKLVAKLNEMSPSGEMDVDPSTTSTTRSCQPTHSQDDEGEEGEISESD